MVILRDFITLFQEFKGCVSQDRRVVLSQWCVCYFECRDSIAIVLGFTGESGVFELQ